MSQYEIYITPETFQAIKKLPGNIKQRIKREIKGLGDTPRPSNSKVLEIPNIDTEIRRLRLDN